MYKGVLNASVHSKVHLWQGAAQVVLGPSSLSSRWCVAVVLPIQVLAVARFDARCVRIWKGQRNKRRLQGDGGRGRGKVTRHACEGNVDLSSNMRRGHHVVKKGRIQGQHGFISSEIYFAESRGRLRQNILHSTQDSASLNLNSWDMKRSANQFGMGIEILSSTGECRSLNIILHLHNIPHKRCEKGLQTEGAVRMNYTTGLFLAM